VFIETHVSDEGLTGTDKDIPLWRFYRLNELNGDHSNWFGPNKSPRVFPRNSLIAAEGAADFMPLSGKVCRNS
jgi:hypothetical protein